MSFAQTETDYSENYDIQTTACRNLLSAVLGSAIHDLKRGLKVPNDETLALRNLAINWFWDLVDSRIPFSELCVSIDYCPKETRAKLVIEGLLPPREDVALVKAPHPYSVNLPD